MSLTTCCCWPRRPSAQRPSPRPRRAPADVVTGRILLGSCRYYEFRVVELDDREERTTIVAETAAQGRLRDFFGFNRARHAVLEAAILATRTEILPLERHARRLPQAGGAGRQDRWTEGAQRPSRSCTAMFTKRPCVMVCYRARASPPHEEPSRSRPHAEPAALRSPGMGAGGRPPVRRRRPHDRIARYRADRRAAPRWLTDGLLAARVARDHHPAFCTISRLRNQPDPGADLASKRAPRAPRAGCRHSALVRGRAGRPETRLVSKVRSLRARPSHRPRWSVRCGSARFLPRRSDR